MLFARVKQVLYFTLIWHVGQLQPPRIVRLKSACFSYFFWDMMLHYWVLASWRFEKT